MEKITSFDPAFCCWCKKIREKYALRKEIAQRLGLEQVAGEFTLLAQYATCPFHSVSVYPQSRSPKKRDFEVEAGRIVFRWWSRNEYRVVFDVRERRVYHSDISSDRFDFHSLFTEFLKMLSEEELRKLYNHVPKKESQKVEQ